MSSPKGLNTNLIYERWRMTRSPDAVAREFGCSTTAVDYHIRKKRAELGEYTPPMNAPRITGRDPLAHDREKVVKWIDQKIAKLREARELLTA